jgi:hypothetical protein
MNQQVTDYIEKLDQEWKADVCNQIRKLVYQEIPDVEERLQYGKPHYLKNGKYACVLSVAKAWVSFTIFNAQTLITPDGLFESSDTGDRKTIKIGAGQDVDYALLAKLLQQATTPQ